MANILEQVGQSAGQFGWVSLGNIAFIVVIILAFVLFFVGIFLFMWWKSFYIRVHIYEPYGQLSLDEEIQQKAIQEAKQGKSDTLASSMLMFDMFKKKRTHGKYTTVKGTPYFSLFMPFKKLEPVSMDMMFDDGVHFLRLSREIFIPIPKPKTIIKVAEEVSVSVTENNKWQAWNNMMADRINNKFQDIDAQKKVVMYFVVGIVSLVLLGGFFFWLMYSSANKGWDAADKFSAAANALGGGKTPV